MKEDKRKNKYKVKSVKSVSSIGDKDVKKNDTAYKLKDMDKKNKLIKFKLTSKNKKLVKITGLIVLVPLLLLMIIVSIFVVDMYKKGVVMQSEIKAFVESMERKDFAGAGEDLISVENNLFKLQSSYNRLSIAGSIPFFGNYYLDGKSILSASENGINVARIITEALMQSDEVIETAGDIALEEGVNSLTQLNYIIESAPILAPKTGKLLEEIVSAREKLTNINPKDYPEKLLDKNIRLHISDILLAIDNSILLLANGDGLIEHLPDIAGFGEDKKYLVIFQNNKELRPTGGFITAYTIANVKLGNFQAGQSDDIYNLDDQYDPSVPAPEPIISNLQGPYLEIENYRLRDMNWNPDFSVSMELLLNELTQVGITDIDGVIAVDTEVLVDLINVIGEIQVPGYGGYSNNIVELCDCEQIIYELEHFADREGPIVWSENEPGKIVQAPENYDDRKKIIGPMMNTIINRVLTLRPSKYPALFNSVMENLSEKHILIYMVDEKHQLPVEEMGSGGRIIDSKGDYLHVNDANLGGKKANLYVTHQVDQTIGIQDDGIVIKTVELTYRNPKPQNNWLNTVLPNYLRIYVPEGSELIEFSGLDQKDEPYEELGKTVFPGLLTVRPMGVTKVKLKYKLPFTVKDRYNLYLQKQPGKDRPRYSIKYGEHEESFELSGDKEIIIDLIN